MSLRVQGNQAYAQKHFDKAIALYTEALKADRKDPAALANRAACYIQLCNWENAAVDARDALTLDPPPQLRIKLLYRLAISSAELGQDPTPYINQGLCSDPNNPDLLRLSKTTFVPVQVLETLPHRYSATPTPAAGPHPNNHVGEDQPMEIDSPPALALQAPTSLKFSTFIPPQLPLTYSGVLNACREHSPDAYDWWYNLDPQQLIEAHRRVGLEPETLEFLRKMVSARGGDQGQRLLDAAKQCNGYDMADMMV